MREVRMYSQDGGPWPSILRIVKHDDGFVYVEVEGIHDGFKVVNAVKVERIVFVHNIKQLGVL